MSFFRKKNKPKTFARDGSDFENLAVGFGACLATDKIIVDGRPIGYMYREEPDNDIDSGWRFLAGDETDKYMDNASNLDVYDINTIANYDPSILPLIESPVGSAFIRQDGKFIPDTET